MHIKLTTTQLAAAVLRRHIQHEIFQESTAVWSIAPEAGATGGDRGPMTLEHIAGDLTASPNLTVNQLVVLPSHLTMGCACTHSCNRKGVCRLDVRPF